MTEEKDPLFDLLKLRPIDNSQDRKRCVEELRKLLFWTYIHVPDIPPYNPLEATGLMRDALENEEKFRASINQKLATQKENRINAKLKVNTKRFKELFKVESQYEYIDGNNVFLTSKTFQWTEPIPFFDYRFERAGILFGKQLVVNEESKLTPESLLASFLNRELADFDYSEDKQSFDRAVTKRFTNERVLASDYVGNRFVHFELNLRRI